MAKKPLIQETEQPSTSVFRFKEQRAVRRGRSTGKSVAIVAGSAGVGAAIGALAGGDGGFAYDRLTHNR
jgi:hypothetical protein